MVYHLGIVLFSLFLFFSSSVQSVHGASAASAGDLWGTTVILQPDARSLPKWTNLLARFESERAELPEEFEEFIAYAQTLRKNEQLAAVQRLAFSLPYVTDEENYGVADYWATPRELAERGGDCEDIAFLAFVLLKRLGWDGASLSIVVVNDKERQLGHAVLLVSYGGKNLVIDNTRRFISDASLITQYQPVYAINEFGVRIYLPKP